MSSHRNFVWAWTTRSCNDSEWEEAHRLALMITCMASNTSLSIKFHWISSLYEVRVTICSHDFVIDRVCSQWHFVQYPHISFHTPYFDMNERIEELQSYMNCEMYKDRIEVIIKPIIRLHEEGTLDRNLRGFVTIQNGGIVPFGFSTVGQAILDWGESLGCLLRADILTWTRAILLQDLISYSGILSQISDKYSLSGRCIS